jgi:uncharacterized protein (DUF1778 family)
MTKPTHGGNPPNRPPRNKTASRPVSVRFTDEEREAIKQAMRDTEKFTEFVRDAAIATALARKQT